MGGGPRADRLRRVDRWLDEGDPLPVRVDERRSEDLEVSSALFKVPCEASHRNECKSSDELR